MGNKMAVTIKSQREIEIMREAGKILAFVHEELEKMVKPGISTMELNKKADELMRKYGCIPSFLGYNGYPASICVSMNDEVIHGIPDKRRILQEGDVVSIDAGVILKGYQSDAARTWAVGEVSETAKRLIRTAEESFFEGIKFAKAGGHLYDISAAVEEKVVANGFSCVRDFVGHGIGTEMHEDPQIPNYRQRRRGMKMVPNMTICVEPMINVGKYGVCMLDDDWTIVTEDGSLSAHYENTILITEGEPEILSL